MTGLPRSQPDIVDGLALARSGMKMRLEAKTKHGTKWVPVYPAQVESFVENGAVLRAFEVEQTNDDERMWCTACGTVTRDRLCDCNRYGEGHEMYREPHFVNYADAMQLEAREQVLEVRRLEKELENAKAYVEKAIASYAGDPADNQFQRGHLAALEVVRDEAFSKGSVVPLEDRK